MTDLWSENNNRRLVYASDLNDDRVFAILSRDYISSEGRLPLIEAKEVFAYDLTDSDAETHYAIKDPTTGELLGYLPKDEQDSWSEPHSEESQGLSYSPLTNPSDPSYTDQTDDAQLLEIVKNPQTQEYRWSYDGGQLHIWRVFNRWSYGPSHYDMFGSDGYENHSQGRVYVSPDKKVGILYWQISHPECEQVLNEWCLKSYGKMPDYVYRAYGKYGGEVRPRWMFPIVEVSGLPLKGKDRWWDNPSATGPSWYEKEIGVNTNTYPAKKQKKVYPGPVDAATGEPVTPGKRRTRKRKRNREYRNRNFGRR